MAPRTNNHGMIQGFAPNRIETAQNLNVEGVLAIRIPEAANYKINNTGDTASMPPGVTVVDESVTTFDFEQSVTIEVMDIT